MDCRVDHEYFPPLVVMEKNQHSLVREPEKQGGIRRDGALEYYS